MLLRVAVLAVGPTPPPPTTHRLRPSNFDGPRGRSAPMKLARKLAILVAVCAAPMAAPLGDAGAVTPTPRAQIIDACGLITAAEVQSLSGQTVELHSDRDTCEIFFPGPDTGAGGGQINIFVYASAANAKRSFHKGKSEDAGVRTIKVPRDSWLIAARGSADTSRTRRWHRTRSLPRCSLSRDASPRGRRCNSRPCCPACSRWRSRISRSRSDPRGAARARGAR